jgi:hypothetical protein
VVVRRGLPFIALAGLLAPAGPLAQTTTAPSATTNQAPATATTTPAAEPNLVPLGRFVPKDNLILYVEFAGLDAHPDAWKNTAACKMLNDTPLGAMLEAVASQLLDKGLTYLPNLKLSGSELVTLTKHAARSGWVLAVNANPKGPDHIRGTFALRGAANKALRPLTSRFMGWLMGSEMKPAIADKAGRPVIVVSAKGAEAANSAADPGWVWWPEKDDLVVGFAHPTSADAIIAALDGKVPSAVDHPQVHQLAKPEGTFQPVCIAFAETANCPEMATKISANLRQLNAERGIQRIDFQWGFDAEALMAVTRLVAPAPRKQGLAVFDGPGFNKGSLMGMPDGVGSFVELSINPSQLVETIKQMAPESGVSQEIEEMAESIRSASQIDLQKDILAHLGPTMIAYLAPGQSAATNDDSLEAALKKGWSPTAAVAALQSVFPKFTAVAEVNKPEAFSKGLDALIIAINAGLRAEAIEKAHEEQTTKDEGGADRRNAFNRGPLANDGSDRRRSLRDTPAPRFNLTPGSRGKLFVLTTPKDSPLQFGPSSFRPTIQLEGKYVAFAVSPDAARAALAAVQRKDWKPAASLERAYASLPSKLTAMIVSDNTDSLASLLASLPGTLQTMINTSIALANSRTSDGKPAAGPGQPGGPLPGGIGMNLGRNRPDPYGPPTGGDPNLYPGPGVPPSRRGAAGFGNPAAGSNDAGSTGDSMVVLKIDADKLPKAADLKAHIFPSVVWVAASPEDIRFVSRGAFPNLSFSTSLAPIAVAIPSFSSTGASSKSPQGSGGTAAPAAPEAARKGVTPDAAGSSAPGPGPQPGTPKGRPGRGGGQPGPG